MKSLKMYSVNMFLYSSIVVIIIIIVIVIK